MEKSERPPESTEDELTIEPKSAVVRPATVAMKVRFPQGGVAMRSNLWHKRTRIAMRAEARAVATHQRGLSSGQIAEALEDQTLESMVAASAVRHAFHHLYLDLSHLLGPDANCGKSQEPKVPILATTELPEDDSDLRAWLDELTQIVTDRARSFIPRKSRGPGYLICLAPIPLNSMPDSQPSVPPTLST